jgi:hypothetical protein
MALSTIRYFLNLSALWLGGHVNIVDHIRRPLTQPQSFPWLQTVVYSLQGALTVHFFNSFLFNNFSIRTVTVQNCRWSLHSQPVYTTAADVSRCSYSLSFSFSDIEWVKDLIVGYDREYILHDSAFMVLTSAMEVRLVWHG